MLLRRYLVVAGVTAAVALSAAPAMASSAPSSTAPPVTPPASTSTASPAAPGTTGTPAAPSAQLPVKVGADGSCFVVEKTAEGNKVVRALPTRSGAPSAACRRALQAAGVIPVGAPETGGGGMAAVVATWH